MTEQAGYSGTPLPRKLGIGEGDEVVVVGAPNGFADRLAALIGDEADIHTDLADAALFDVIIAFASLTCCGPGWLRPAACGSRGPSGLRR